MLVNSWEPLVLPHSQFLLYTLTSSEETVGSVGDSCRGIFLVKMLCEVAAPINLLSKNSSSW